MKQLAIPLSNPKTVAKWLVISGKPDVKLTLGRFVLIAQQACPELVEVVALLRQRFQTNGLPGINCNKKARRSGL
jgi:hypothetical protein